MVVKLTAGGRAMDSSALHPLFTRPSRRPTIVGFAGGRRPSGPIRNPLAGAARQSRQTRQWLSGGCQTAARLDENGEDLSHGTISHDFKMALQRARLAKKMDQAALAFAIDEKLSVINDCESGKAIPSDPIINKLNRVLGVRLPKVGQHKAGKEVGVARNAWWRMATINTWPPDSCLDLSGVFCLADGCVYACDIQRPHASFSLRYRCLDAGLPCDHIGEFCWKDERRERRDRALLRARAQRRHVNSCFGNRKPILHTRGLKREDKRLLRASAASGHPITLSYAALRNRKAGGGRHKAGQGAADEIKSWLPDSCLELDDVLGLAHKWVHACDIKRYASRHRNEVSRYASRYRDFDDGLPCNYIDESWWKDERRERRARGLMRALRSNKSGPHNHKRLAPMRKLSRANKTRFHQGLAPVMKPWRFHRGHRKASQFAACELGEELGECLQDMRDARNVASELDGVTLDDQKSADPSHNAFHLAMGVDLRQKKDVDSTNQVHYWRMALEAGASLSNSSKHQLLRIAKRSVSFKAACTNVLDELQPAIHHVGAVLSIAQVAHKMRAGLLRFLRIVAPIVRGLRSRHDTDVREQLAARPELSAHEELSLKLSTKLQVIGSIFTAPCTVGDFKWMLEADVYPRALYVFNDNDADHHGCSRGGGNAAIRPYNRYNLHFHGIPRSAGVSTGFSSALGGFQALDARARTIIDRDISEIKGLLSTGHYDRVIYSASSDGSGLGTGIFCVAPAVKDYIVSELKKLDGETAAELMEHRTSLQAEQSTTRNVSWARGLITAHDQLAALKDNLSVIDALLAFLRPKCSHAALLQAKCSVTQLKGSVNSVYMSPSDMRSKEEQLKEKRRAISDVLSVASSVDGVWLGVLRRLVSEADSKVTASLAQPESPCFTFSSVSEFFHACVVRAALRYQPLLCRVLSRGLRMHTNGTHQHIDISVALVSFEVQESFYNAWCRMPDAMDNFKLAFHGTSCSNLSSICKRGLLIPGKDNNLQVRHGSAHGLGVYLANLDALSLSLGFADTNDEDCGKRQLGLLVCGVLDDARPCSDGPERDRRRPFFSSVALTARSKSVHHVGDALVVFDSSRVVPLFVVSLQCGSYAITLRAAA